MLLVSNAAEILYSHSAFLSINRKYTYSSNQSENNHSKCQKIEEDRENCLDVIDRNESIFSLMFEIIAEF